MHLVSFGTSAVPWDWRLCMAWQHIRQILCAYPLNLWELYTVQAAALLLFSCRYLFRDKSWNSWLCWLPHSLSTSNQGKLCIQLQKQTQNITHFFKYQHSLICTGIRTQWLGMNLQQIWGSKQPVPIPAQNSGTGEWLGTCYFHWG